MTPEDVHHYRPLISCDISDDGRYVAVVTPTGPHPAPVLLVCELAAGKAWKPLEPMADTWRWVSPAIAPDSRRVACIRTLRGSGSRPPKVEVVVAPLDRSEPPTPAVGVPHEPSTLKWRGAALCCLGDDDAGWRRIWAWEDGLREPPTPLTPPGIHAADYAFSPDGERLAWLHCPPASAPERETEALPLRFSDARGGETEVRRTPGRPIGYLAWSPDGRWLAYLARRRGDRLSGARLWVLDPSRWPRDPNAARCLTREDPGWITGYDWLADGSLALATVESTEGQVHQHFVDGSPRRRLIRRRGHAYLSAPHADRREGLLCLLEQDTDKPQRLILRRPDGRCEVRSHFNRRLGPRTGFHPASTLTWTNPADGQRLEGVVVRPRGARRAPLITWLHGGPAEHVARTFSSYFQVFAEAGFCVFAPNYRGSTGRGDAFIKANVGDLGGADAADVLAGIDRLVQMKIADPFLATAVGWSYGGTLALRIAAQSDILRALVVGAPVVDWVSLFGAPRRPGLFGEYFPTAIWEDRRPFDAASPITHLARVSTPTLVLHGQLDPLVPVGQGRLLYRALAAKGVPTDLMIYPDEGHVPGRPDAVEDMLVRIVRWLRTHMRHDQ